MEVIRQGLKAGDGKTQEPLEANAHGTTNTSQGVRSSNKRSMRTRVSALSRHSSQAWRNWRPQPFGVQTMIISALTWPLILKRSKKPMCDSILMLPGSTTTHKNRIYKATDKKHTHDGY
jgi:hypothetical protein